MRRGVRPESAGRLLELTLAPDPVSAARLVPGNGDVDETLQEVPLGGPRRAPGDLELLVRLEVPPAADQFEPALVWTTGHSRRLTTATSYSVAATDMAGAAHDGFKGAR